MALGPNQSIRLDLGELLRQTREADLWLSRPLNVIGTFEIKSDVRQGQHFFS